MLHLACPLRSVHFQDNWLVSLFGNEIQYQSHAPFRCSIPYFVHAVVIVHDEQYDRKYDKCMKHAH
ncbi:hypothetical protein T12_15613 [Trichinella patagoniensis]|uniref:Uncharacterized protein n=1 Tax=Trichinella patagoniensis TaxID=990121 RepID=A0A0V0ZWL5_9BILA|nr:hypothetical protein T12_15613 [Trichinella patagoniensis]